MCTHIHADTCKPTFMIWGKNIKQSTVNSSQSGWFPFSFIWIQIFSHPIWSSKVYFYLHVTKWKKKKSYYNVGMSIWQKSSMKIEGRSLQYIKSLNEWEKLKSELRRVMIKMMRNKVAGPDNFLIEILTALDLKIDKVTEVKNEINDSGEIPENQFL